MAVGELKARAGALAGEVTSICDSSSRLKFLSASDDGELEEGGLLFAAHPERNGRQTK